MMMTAAVVVLVAAAAAVMLLVIEYWSLCLLCNASSAGMVWYTRV